MKYYCVYCYYKLKSFQNMLCSKKKYGMPSIKSANHILQAVLDGYGWLLKDQSSRLPHVNKFLKKVPDYQVKWL